MKTIGSYYIAIMTAALVLFVSCDKNDEETEGSSYEGSYAVTGAILTAPMTLTTNEIGDYTLQPGTDITGMIQQALFSAVGCEVPENTRIELRADNSLFMTCEGEDSELNAGTWEEVSSSAMKLNMNSSAIPSSPTGIVLEVTNITITENTLNGNSNVPLSEAMLEIMVADGSNGIASLDTDATPDVVMVSIDISFTKK